MSEIKTVLFDLDDTLLDFKRSESEAIKKTMLCFGASPTEERIKRYNEINSEMWQSLERGERSRAEIRTARFASLFSELNMSISPEKARDVYENELSKCAFFIPNAESVLACLSRKYSLYLASNGTASVQKSRIRLSGISKYFKGIFISDLIGYNKPSREFFSFCFSKIDGFKKEETIIVGDSLTSDISGGRNAGILTCLYNPEEKPIPEDIKPDYKIKTLTELPLILKRL